MNVFIKEKDGVIDIHASNVLSRKDVDELINQLNEVKQGIPEYSCGTIDCTGVFREVPSGITFESNKHYVFNTGIDEKMYHPKYFNWLGSKSEKS